MKFIGIPISLCLGVLGGIHAQDPPPSPPGYTTDQGFIDRLEVDFNKDLGNEPDPEGELPEGWVFFESGSNIGSAPEGATRWTVYFETGTGAFGSTWNLNGKTSTKLDYEYADVNIDPSPSIPGMTEEEVNDFWLLVLWHEWHHSIHADPSDFGYPAENPPVSFPVPRGLECDHLKLDLMDIDEACSRVAALIAAEEVQGDNCKQIAVLCSYIEEKVKSCNGAIFDRAAQNCPNVNPVPESSPPRYHEGCLCCLTYSLSSLCGSIGSIFGQDFSDDDLSQIND